MEFNQQDLNMLVLSGVGNVSWVLKKNLIQSVYLNCNIFSSHD